MSQDGTSARPAAPARDTAPVPDAVHSLGWLRGLPPLSPEEVWQRALEVTDARTGAFATAGEDDLAQAPLHVTRVTVNGTPRATDRREGAAIFGCGDTLAWARADAALHAFACYAATRSDERLLLDEDGRPLPPGGQPVSAHVWGWDLVSQTHAMVRAPAALPAVWAATRTARPAGQAWPPGVAAGREWDEAVENGLRSLCRDLIITAARRPGRRFPTADIQREADDEAQRYRAMLAMADEPAEAYDLTCVAGVPAFAFRGIAGTVACTVGTDRGGALSEGLRLLLLDCQARANAQPQYRPGCGPRLPAGQPAMVAPGSRTHGHRSASIAALTAAVLRLGRSPIVVPLSHDAALSRVMPFTVHVMGACAETSRGWGHLSGTADRTLRAQAVL